MAQAARLHQRMHKELKLLLTDPPPGASFPLLSVDSDVSSLSTVHAQIEGPEGTVYAKGIFRINIQIPDRYPFQPPSVTFGTPIYHPNIDNGGRICLDILNLPPKGAWRPSLNISTVLTSIGLLLSEPNPDDGLMCEASREYKYNRQAFDRKARLMTEKYAKRDGGNGCSSQGVQTNFNPGMSELRGSEKSRLEVSESFSSQQKPCGISQKLSLEFSSSSKNRDDNSEVNGVHNYHLFFPGQVEAKGKRKGVNVIPDECKWSCDKLYGSRRKLSLESSCQIHKTDGYDKENLVTIHSSLCNLQTASMASSGSSVLQPNKCSQQKLRHPQTNKLVTGSTNMTAEQLCQFGEKQSLESLDTFQINDNEGMPTPSQVLPPKSLSSASHAASLVTLSELQPHKTLMHSDRVGNCSTAADFKKIRSVGMKLSLGCKGSTQVKKMENKENVAPPVDKQPLSCPQSSSIKRGIVRKLSLGALIQLEGSNDNNKQFLVHPENLFKDSSMTLAAQQDYVCKEKQSNQEQDAKVGGKSELLRVEDSPISEAVIVLDSEDSEDEKDGALKSKLLTRKLIGTWRGKA